MSTESRTQLDDPKGYTKGLSPKQWQRSKWLKTFEQMNRRFLFIGVAFFLILVIFSIVTQSIQDFHAIVGTGNRTFIEEEADPKIREIFSCYHKRHEDLHVELLEDIQLSSRQPKLDTSIFFVITTCLPNNLVEIRRRQACSIESTARHNPDRDIFIVFTSPAGFAGNSSDPFDRLMHVPEIIKRLNAFPNIHLRNANLTTFIVGTPMEALERRGLIYRSTWPPIHLSDVMRLLVIYRYGGIYLDSDLIVMKSFREMSPVFLTEEEQHFLNNGAMGTTHDGFGHEFFEEMITVGAKGYTPTVWSTIGRDILAANLKRKCNMEKLGDDNSRCPEMTIYPQYMFHPFAFEDDAKVWNTTEPNAELMERIKDGYAVHLWSSRSQKFHLNTDDKSVINVIAAQNCPTIYNLDRTFND